METQAFASFRACLEGPGTPGCPATWQAGAWLAVIAVTALWLAPRAWRVAVTWRGMALTPAFSRFLSRIFRSAPYDEEGFFRADGAGVQQAERRRQGFERLAVRLRERGKKSIAWGRSAREGLSDLRFADANRVPPAFGAVMRERFDLSSVVTASEGPHLLDLDGHWNLDVGGSYGVNVLGYDRYKEMIERGWERVRDLGPVLGPLHPVVAENIELLKRISGQDEVSFHVSGTEAVMSAVRLARFNTGRKLIVTFSGAYHGWWDGVQPGLGSERALDDCLPLKDLDPAALEVIRRRAGEIAGVLVNPVQSFHPNAPPPNDAVLLSSGVRRTEGSDERYRRWLQELRRVCSESGVPLLFDEVYSGFRLAPGGAQERFGVKADMVLYGKTVAGGMPIGLVCGRRDLMRRFDPDRPMRIAYVVGTFSAHPLVMGAMNEFLRWVVTDEAAELYARGDERCATWADETNRALAEEELPVRIGHLGTVWTVLFTEPGRYNWLLQYYLRAEGVALSWVGTGRCLASLDYSDHDYDELRHKLLEAARAMERDGWWLTREEQPGRDWKMRIRLMGELARGIARLPQPVQGFLTEIKERKHHDHEASHHDSRNQALHLVSSSVFIVCYGLVFRDLTLAVMLGLGALFLRQIGHAVFEPPCHDKERLLLGYTTRNKSLVLGTYLAIPVALWIHAGVAPLAWLSGGGVAEIARWWFGFTLAVVLGRVAFLMGKHSVRDSLVWLVKLVTDPFTDVVAYSPRLPGRR